jgi:Holliday junction resolvase RusA-like endonuclease
VVGKVYQDRGQAIDLTNAFEGAWDVLESAGVLANDYQITGCTLERRRDRDNPRIEISIHLRNCEDDL